MQEVHAVLLTGGSAFGLAAADGVMRYLEERGIGYPTPWARVPIVPGAVIFDLNAGSPAARPNAESGYLACVAAKATDLRNGSVGAGVGATVGKWAGIGTRMRGGLGLGTIEHDGLVVTVVAVVNAVGDVLSATGQVLAGARSKEGRFVAEGDSTRMLHLPRTNPLQMTNTTLIAVLTNARLSKVDVNRIAQRGHDGLARALKPVHTMYDGDVVFGLACGEIEAGVDLVAEAGADAAAAAVRDAVCAADPHPLLPTLRTV